MDEQWQEAWTILDRVAVLPAHRRAFVAALHTLERLGLSPVRVERALLHFWAQDRLHAAAQVRANLGIRFSVTRQRARRDLAAAINAALRVYTSFYKAPPPASPIYGCLRELRGLLKTSFAAAAAHGHALPDILSADSIWEKRLRRPQRGRRRKPHRASAEAELRAAKVPNRLIPVLLRSVAAPPASK